MIFKCGSALSKPQSVQVQHHHSHACMCGYSLLLSSKSIYAEARSIYLKTATNIQLNVSILDLSYVVRKTRADLPKQRVAQVVLFNRVRTVSLYRIVDTLHTVMAKFPQVRKVWYDLASNETDLEPLVEEAVEGYKPILLDQKLPVEVVPSKKTGRLLECVRKEERGTGPSAGDIFEDRNLPTGTTSKTYTVTSYVC